MLADTDGTTLLPVNLSPSQDSTATKVVFETPAEVQPQLRVEVQKSDSLQGLLEFMLTAKGATIPKPTVCENGASTILRTHFTLVDGTHAPVTVTAVHPWQCNGDQLQTVQQ